MVMKHLVWALLCLLVPALRLCSRIIAQPLSFAAGATQFDKGPDISYRKPIRVVSLTEESGTLQQEPVHERHAWPMHTARPQGLRMLQQQLQKEPVIRVATPQQLVDAVEEGAANIEIKEHLDLTTLEPRTTLGLSSMLNENSTDPIVASSIRGACKSPAIESELQISTNSDVIWKHGQCTIITATHFLTVNQNFWLDKLHIRYKPTSESNTQSLLACMGASCNMWTTFVHLEGNGIAAVEGGLIGGLQVVGGHLYGEDLYITNFASRTSALKIRSNATVNLEGCSLSNNRIVPDLNSTVVTHSAVISMTGGGNVLRLRQAEIALNSAPHAVLVADSDSAEVFSDEDQAVYYSVPGTGLNSTLPMFWAPEGREGITGQSEWLMDLRQNLRRGPKKRPKRDNGTETWPIIVGVVAAAVTCLVLLTATIILCLRGQKRRRQKLELKRAGELDSGVTSHRNVLAEIYDSSNVASAQTTPQHFQQLLQENEKLQLQLRQQQQLQQTDQAGFRAVRGGSLSQGGSLGGPQGGSQGGFWLGMSSNSCSRSHLPSHSNSHSNSHSQSQGDVELGRSDLPPQHMQTTTIEIETDTADASDTHAYGARQSPPLGVIGATDAADSATRLPPQPPRQGASRDERAEFVQQQLDGFGLDVPVFGDLLLLGHGDRERRFGGQSVVQMAVCRRTRMDCAIKFFLSRAAFHEENALYEAGADPLASALSQFLPKVLAAHGNADGKLVDLDGHALPPCIVMERGTSLDVWALHGKPDRFQAATVMSQVAVRLRDLHALGYVHRDLKPANVMWLPRENRWTLIDFGCVAKTGENARLGFTLAYAAPEVVAAYRRGAQCMVAEEAVDAWSLGVMAFELLTGKQALPMILGKDHVMDRIEGLRVWRLPWEDGNLTAEHRRKLGVFKPSVLSLLHREPSARPSMEEFCEICNQVLAGASSVTL